MKVPLLFIIVCLGIMPSVAKTPDSLFFFDLSQKIGLKYPKLYKEEYEIRLWVKTALAYGEAQELYIIHQKKNRLTLRRYFFYFQKRQYLKHTVTFTASLRDTSFWNSLMSYDVLTLPNGHEIVDEIIKEERQKMNQSRDTTLVEIINDSIRVVGRRSRGKQMLVLDGTSYYFETFTKQ